jgi:hypothetical protein
MLLTCGLAFPSPGREGRATNPCRDGESFVLHEGSVDPSTLGRERESWRPYRTAMRTEHKPVCAGTTYRRLHRQCHLVPGQPALPNLQRAQSSVYPRRACSWPARTP